MAKNFQVEKELLEALGLPAGRVSNLTLEFSNDQVPTAHVRMYVEAEGDIVWVMKKYKLVPLDADDSPGAAVG